MVAANWLKLDEGVDVMVPPDTVEQLLKNWRSELKHGSFIYSDSASRFGSVVAAHFRSRSLSEKVYGVYIIRQQKTAEILYIGKGGTINGQGQYKGQDIPGRLCATRGKDISGKEVSSESWICELFQENGILEVEYLEVEHPISPGYVEVLLLQSYLTQYARLPKNNKSL